MIEMFSIAIGCFVLGMVFGHRVLPPRYRPDPLYAAKREAMLREVLRSGRPMVMNAGEDARYVGTAPTGSVTRE